MPVAIHREPPDSFAEMKQAVYQGDLFLLPAFPQSLELVGYARQLLRESFPSLADVQKIHVEFTDDFIYRTMLELRKTLSAPDLSRRFIANITQPLGLVPLQTVFDPLRLRWNPPKEYFDEQAVYSSVHRDTWYANPQCQLNWWMPLFDVTEEQTFRFFGDYFTEAIPNTSSDFDYSNWARNVGFQTSIAVSAQQYPTATIRPVDENITGFSCCAGDILVFSAAQLHRTAYNRRGLTRFSLDFRTVDLEDQRQGRGAPNADNASTGDATVDYLRLV